MPWLPLVVGVGGSLLGGLFGGNKRNTSGTGLDPQSQAYVNQMRGMAGNAAQTALNPPGGNWFMGPLSEGDISSAMNPFISNVVDSTRAEFDHLRGLAGRDANAQATAAAFGGSRHGVMAGARMGELDRAQGSQIANLMQQGYGQALSFAEHQRQLAERQLQSPLFANQQALNFMNFGMGPVGQQNTQPRNWFGSALGGAQAGMGISGGNPWGGAIGGILGGIFG